MPDALRISADELKGRMQAGEDFVLIDTRNPHAWAESGEKAAGAIRFPLDEVDEHISRLPEGKPIVAYCT